MPNNTNNRLILTGPWDDLTNFFDFNKADTSDDADDRLLSFRKCVPLESDTNKEIDWYAESITKWGTKWNAYEIEVMLYDTHDRIEYRFRTAWSPPQQWLIGASKKFPTLTFTNFAEDEFLNFFCSHKYIDGRETELFNHDMSTMICYFRDEKKIKEIDIYNYLIATNYPIDTIIEKYINNDNLDGKLDYCLSDDDSMENLKDILDDFSNDHELLNTHTASDKLLEYLVDWLKINPTIQNK